MRDASVTVRLPTRCPTCKGSVIERTPSPAHGTFVWFHCLFCNHWWKFRLDDTYANPNGHLTGEVFIVTKAGMTYKLAAVAVTAIPEEPLKKHMESKTAEGELESQKLRREIAGLTATLKMAQADEDRLWKILQRDESNSRKAAAWSVAYNKTKSVTKQIKKLQTERQHLTSGDYFFEGLPSGIATAKTNANGKFSLTIPRKGRYGVVARASRELFKQQETYFWLVWVSLEAQATKRLVLNNDNIMCVGSPDPALK